MAAGDFNRDENPDLAVGGSSGVVLLLGNGDGTFQATQDLAGGIAGNLSSAAVADFNQDGNPDLAVDGANETVNGNSHGNVFVLLGRGDGTFQAPADYPVGDGTEDVAAADIDGDGRLDLVTANVGDLNFGNSDHGGVSELLGNGDGTFQAARNLLDNSTGLGPGTISAGDFDHNGTSDLVIANPNSSPAVVSVLLNNGNGTFQNPETYLANSGDRLAVADLNGDGVLDIAFPGADGATVGASVLLGNGDGTFQNLQTFSGGGLSGDLAEGDFNGDGKLDLALRNEVASVGTSVGVLLSEPITSAKQLAVSGPGAVTAGLGFDTTVTAQNASGQADPSYLGTVHFAGAAGLPSDYTFTSADQGRHTFHLTLTDPGNPTVTVTDTSDSSLAGSLTLQVNAAPQITGPAPLPAEMVGQPYQQTVAATGGTGTLTFTLSAGNLPAGLGLNANTGVLSGTPTADGTFGFTITATDSLGASAAHTFSLTISPQAAGSSQADGASNGEGISADGRYVVFTSLADNLVPGDTNAVRDVFVYDRQTQTTTRVNVASDGTQANGDSTFAAISGDGRYVVFESSASNLVPADTNGVSDIFVRDLQTQTTTRISAAPDGTQGNATSFSSPVISPDGRYIVFASLASNLVPGGTNGAEDVFVYDQQTHTNTRVGNGLLGFSAISADGRYLLTGDIHIEFGFETVGDVSVYDRQTQTKTVLSVAPDGSPSDDESGGASISGDGRYVVFTSRASNLVPGDNIHRQNVFLRDLQTQTTTQISLAVDGSQVNDDILSAAISADGRYVVFESFADNLVSGDSNGTDDVFVYDRQTQTTSRVSITSDGAQANGESFFPAISADGRYVTFTSVATNLVPGDTNGVQDAFVYDRQTQTTTRVSVPSASTDQAPVVASPLPDQNATQDQPFTFAVPAATFSDPDGDALGHSVSTLPPWLTFDAATRTFSGTPGAGDVGATDITVTASDGKGGSVTDTFHLTVAAAPRPNQAPVVASPLPDQSATQDQPFTFAVPAPTFSDSDGDSLSFSTSPLPAWLAFDATTHAFNGTPAAGDVGAIDITVSVSDGRGGSVTDTFHLAVLGASVPPTPLPVALAQVSGTVFRDYNGNGGRDGADTGLADRTVYLDLNGNLALDAGEPAITTDAAGHYTLTDVLPGTYSLRQILLPGDRLSIPDGGRHTVTLAAGDSLQGLDFGDRPASAVTPPSSGIDPFAVTASDAETAVTEALYRAVLGRNADDSDLQFWVNGLRAGGDRQQLALSFLQSEEQLGRQVDDYYRAFLGRDADAAGRAYWVALLQSGADPSTVIADFLTSPEFVQAHSGNADFVRSLYGTLLGRGAEDAGLRYWTGLLDAGLGRDQVVQSFFHSTEALTRALDGLYTAYLQREVEPLGQEYWLDQVQGGAMSLSEVAAALLGSDEFLGDASRGG